MQPLVYRRILLKLSGEALGSGGVDQQKLKLIVHELKFLRRLGVELAIVVGGGNFWRKRNQGKQMDERTADYLGLLATVMNSLALKSALHQSRLPSTLYSPVAFDLPGVERFDAILARGSLRRGEIVIFAGGTGRPFFTTDTAAAQRAIDVKAQVVVKAGPVDGVYSADPKKVRGAKKFSDLTLREAIKRHLGVMDRQAFRICAKAQVPIVVCKWGRGAVAKVALGRSIGTIITS